MPRGRASRARYEHRRRAALGRVGNWAWSRARPAALARDGWRCRVAEVAAGTYRPELGPWAGTLVVSPECSGGDRALLQVHHVRGTEVGDDPRWLLAACRACNLATGDPRARDARPDVVTRW